MTEQVHQDITDKQSSALEFLGNYNSGKLDVENAREQIRICGGMMKHNTDINIKNRAAQTLGNFFLKLVREEKLNFNLIGSCIKHFCNSGLITDDVVSWIGENRNNYPNHRNFQKQLANQYDGTTFTMVFSDQEA